MFPLNIHIKITILLKTWPTLLIKMTTEDNENSITSCTQACNIYKYCIISIGVLTFVIISGRKRYIEMEFINGNNNKNKSHL